jgi:glycosyltransferase involved in cell wall biosynthesis
MAAEPIRLALLAASPMWFQAPVYSLLAADPRIDFTAIFASSAGVRPANIGYSEPVAWDVDALSGYRSVFLKNAGHAEIESASFFRHRDLDIVPTLVKGNYDVLWVHGYASMTHVMAILTQLTRRRPLLIREEQTHLHPRPRVKAALKRAILSAICRKAYALCIGTENQRWFQSYGVSPERQFRVPYAVDNDHFRREAKRLAPHAAELRSTLGIRDPSLPVILSVGRLIPKKQPLFLLEAFRRLRERRPCSLLLVGSGELESELRRAIHRQQIPDVAMPGFLKQSQIARAYAAADVFTLPSRIHETWGTVVNEAMNFGLPIVVSDKVGCAADLVEEGANGFVVSATDPSELADRLERLVDSPGLRRDFGRRSRELISQFTAARAATAIRDAVAAAVGQERWAAAGGATERHAAVGGRTS